MTYTMSERFKDVRDNYDTWKNIQACQYFEKRKQHHMTRFVYIKDKDKKLCEDKLSGSVYCPLSPDGDKTEFQEIPESLIPIGVSEEGEVVCLKKTKELGNIGCVGIKGTGKTVLFNRIMGCSFLKWNYKIVFLNDYHAEMSSHIYPLKTKRWRDRLDFVAEKGVGLPIVMVIPNLVNDDFKLSFQNVPKIKYKIPFDVFCKNISMFVNLGESKKYFDKLVEEMLKQNFKTRGEVLSFLNEKIEKKVSGSKARILATITKPFLDGLINFDKKSTGILFDKKRNIKEDVFIALARNEVVPVFETYSLYQNVELFGGMINYIVSTFNDKQKPNNDKEFSEKPLLIGVDEISTLFQVEEKQAEKLKETLRKISHTGRFFNIALVYCTQTISDKNIDSVIKNESKFMFGFRSKEDDAIYLKKFMGLSKKQYADLENLKPLECYAWTSEHFVLFSNNMIPRKVNGVLKMKILPALSQSQTPHNIHEINQTSSRDYEHKDFGDFTSYTRGYAQLKGIELYNESNGRNILEDTSNRTDRPTIPLKEIPKANIPKFFNYVDYQTAFFGESYIGSIIIDYHKLLVNNYKIVRLRRSLEEVRNKKSEFIYTIRSIEEISKMDNKELDVAYENKPNGIQIIYNKKNKEVRLIGKECSDKRFMIPL